MVVDLNSKEKKDSGFQSQDIHCLKTQTLLLQFKDNNPTSMYVTKLFIARKFMLLFLICKKHASWPHFWSWNFSRTFEEENYISGQ